MALVQAEQPVAPDNYVYGYKISQSLKKRKVGYAYMLGMSLLTCRSHFCMKGTWMLTCTMHTRLGKRSKKLRTSSSQCCIACTMTRLCMCHSELGSLSTCYCLHSSRHCSSCKSSLTRTSDSLKVYLLNGRIINQYHMQCDTNTCCSRIQKDSIRRCKSSRMTLCTPHNIVD